MKRFEGVEGSGVGASVTLGRRLSTSEQINQVMADCYSTLGPLVTRQVRRLVPPDLVDDTVQAVFVDLWRGRAEYDPSRSLEAWMLTIARRRAVDQFRAEARHTCRATAIQDADCVRDDTLAFERAHDVRRALAHLPEPQREALVLAYFAQLTQREIADRLDIPLGTVKARTARGLHRMGKLL